MSRQQAMTIVHYSGPFPCPVCGAVLVLTPAQGRKSGKAYLMLRCPKNGRHFRAFIHDEKYVAYVIQKLETAE